MEQLSIFPLPYKYIIDTCSLLEQKDGRAYKKTIHKNLWANIEQLIKEKEIVVCREISDEIKDEELELYLSNLQCDIIEASPEIQNKVAYIVNNSQLLNYKSKSGKSSGDAFLIATAIVHKLIIITEEKKNSVNKIPMVAKQFSVESVNINELCEKEGWTF